jgi:threonine dehydrogenase-like Zn-dependent dehydrogenase
MATRVAHHLGAGLVIGADPVPDRLAALYTAIDVVRRGGTLSISGVHGGAADSLPLPDAPKAYAAFQDKENGRV